MPNPTSISPRLSLALVDGHCVLRDGMESLFEATCGFSVVGSFSDPKELAGCLRSFQVDVIITEILFSEVDALRCIADWAKEFSETKVLVLSQFPESAYAERALNAGAAGYLMKDTPTERIIEAVREVHSGQLALSPTMSNQLLSNFSRWRSENPGDLSKLSDRELLVLTMVGQGHTTAAIAHTMGISKKTVSTFKERIKVKLSLDNGLQLTQVAMQNFGRSA